MPRTNKKKPRVTEVRLTPFVIEGELRVIRKGKVSATVAVRRIDLAKPSGRKFMAQQLREFANIIELRR